MLVERVWPIEGSRDRVAARPSVVTITDGAVADKGRLNRSHRLPEAAAVTAGPTRRVAWIGGRVGLCDETSCRGRIWNISLNTTATDPWIYIYYTVVLSVLS